MSTVTLVLLAIASVSLYATLVTSQPAPYELRVERHDPSSQDSTVDLIILQCVDQSTRQVLPPRNVVFWLNRVRPDDRDFKDKDYVLIDDNRILFQLREEGYYTCGIRVGGANVQESERVPLIVLQRIFGDLRIRATTRYFVTAGGTVRLQCPVQPRGLYNYYYGYWERNGTRIIEVPRPSNDGQVANIMRHSSEIVELDRQTFTLTIRSVNRSQASDSYRCVLHNLNPDNGNAQQFTQAASLSISLMVDEKPSVLEGPEPVIVGLQNAMANPPTFNCVVGGAPAPSLIWSYIPGLDEDRSAIFLENRDEYDITTNVSAQDNGLTVVNSTVKFLKVANTDGGIVRCNARRDPATVYEDALLTVLGTADDIDVIVSRDGDVIYELVFPIEIQHPVALNITYTNERGEVDSTIPDIRFSNTKTISYRDTASELPFAVFYVSIALIGVNGSERIAGPSTASQQKIDTTKPDPITVIAISVGSVSIVLMIVVAIIIVASCICCFKLKTLSLKHFEKMFDDPDKYTKHLGSEEAKEEFMKKVLKAHCKSMGLGRIRTDGEEEDVTDLFIQFLLESAVKGVGSDSESKKEFIKAVKTAIGTTSNEKQDQGPNVQVKEPNVQPSLKDGEVEVGRYECVYHPGRDVSNDEVIDMSPTGTRKNTDPSRLISTSV